MTVSVLIPAYNAGHLIGAALSSLSRQSLADWELVVIEDGSRDQTEQAVDAFAAVVPQSVRYCNLGSNHGISAARNRAVEEARGDLLAFLDADDYWDDHYLADAVDQIMRGADLVVSAVSAFDFASGDELYRRAPDYDLLEDPLTALIKKSVIVTCSGVLLKRSLCQRVGAFDIKLLVGEDRDYWLRCAMQGARFGLSPDAVVHYAKHAGGTLTKVLLWAEQDVAFQRKHGRLEQVAASVRRQALSQALENHGRLLRHGYPGRSAGRLLEAWRLAPWRMQRLAQAAYSLLQSAFPSANRRTTP